MAVALAALTLAAVALAACGAGAPRGSDAAATLRLVDDAGDTVALTVPARRIVSLDPATTELLFALGAGDAVVGRTTWCDFPPEAAAVPSVGDGINPNVEAVLGRRPDLVLLYSSGQNAAAVERLAALGIPALRFTSDRLADVPRLARLLGRLTGRERAGDSLAAAFERDLALASQPPSAGSPSAFLLVWDQPPMTVGRGSFLTELMRRAGLRNIFDDVPASSAVVSLEAVAARDPDLILSLGAAAPRIEGRLEWQAVPAVRARRFVRAEGSEFSRASPRAPAAIRMLRALVTQTVGEARRPPD